MSWNTRCWYLSLNSRRPEHSRWLRLKNKPKNKVTPVMWHFFDTFLKQISKGRNKQRRDLVSPYLLSLSWSQMGRKTTLEEQLGRFAVEMWGCSLSHLGFHRLRSPLWGSLPDLLQEIVDLEAKRLDLFVPCWEGLAGWEEDKIEIHFVRHLSQQGYYYYSGKWLGQLWF